MPYSSHFSERSSPLNINGLKVMRWDEMSKWWQNTRKQDDESQMMHIQNRRDEEPKHWVTEGSSIGFIPAFTTMASTEGERASSWLLLFSFSSRMQAFNRLVDHVTQRLPLSVKLAKAHTEHAQSVQISVFFSLLRAGQQRIQAAISLLERSRKCIVKP